MLKLAGLYHLRTNAIKLIFLDAHRSIETGFRWQSFNGTDLRYMHDFFSEISTLVSSYINENDDIWVNGEDLKYEYTYFAVDEMSGEINISGETSILLIM